MQGAWGQEEQGSGVTVWLDWEARRRAVREELRGVRVEKGARRLCREFLFQAGSSGVPFPGSSHILEELLPRGAVWAEWAGCKQGGPRAGGDCAGPRGWPSAQPWSWRGFGTSKAWVPAHLRVSHPPLFPLCPCSQGPCSAAPLKGQPCPRPGVAWGPLENSLSGCDPSFWPVYVGATSSRFPSGSGEPGLC